jgi:mannose-6-phosphate isomerase class I
VDESGTNPDNFCRVDLSKPDPEIRRDFPNFPGKGAAAVVEVKAGEMLYLPAGWFHEVIRGTFREHSGNI